MNAKKLITALLCAIMLCSSAASAKTLEFTIGQTDYYVNSGAIEQKALEAAPYIANGRTLVPIRAVAEAFDADVAWNGEERKVTITSGSDALELIIDSTEATVNGKAQTLDAAPVIADGRTMVPLRFVSEALKKNVEYVGASSQILITDEKPVMTIDGYPVTVDDYRFMFLYYNLTEGRYTPDVLVPALTQSFVENIAIANEAKAKGFELHHSQGTELASSILSDKEILYPLSLTAPGVKVISDIMCASQYYSQRFDYEFADERILQEYNENYVCAKHILISTIDEKTGEPMNERQLRSAKMTADNIYKSAKAGEDFDALIAKHSADPGSASYPNGYVFTRGEMVSEFETAAFSLDENEITGPVKSQYGFHIIMRCPLPAMNEQSKIAIGNKMLQSDVVLYTQDVVEKSKIVTHKTNEEIIAALGIDNDDIDALIAQIVASQK